jgi:hypothetical protein
MKIGVLQIVLDGIQSTKTTNEQKIRQHQATETEIAVNRQRECNQTYFVDSEPRRVVIELLE